MKNINGNDMTTGGIPKQFGKFAVPMAIGLFLNIGYSIINTIWVGNLLGASAVGAVTVSFPIIFILISVASGSTTATSILVSQNYGSKNLKIIDKVISNSFILFSFTGAVLSTVMIITRGSLLRAMGTPANLLKPASGYLLIQLLSFFLTYVYYILNAIFSGIGDTKTPVIFLLLSTGVNAVLDPILIKTIGLNGAAIASLAAGLTALVGVIIYISKGNFIVKISLKKLKADVGIILKIIKLGLPATIQQCLMPLSLIFITTYINRFGADAITAYGIASKIDYLAIIPGMALSSAASVLTGQNIGAGKQDKLKDILKWGIFITFIVMSCVSLLVSVFPKSLLSAFVHDNMVIGIGTVYLKYNAIGYLIFSVTYISNGILTGSGKTMFTMLISTISLIFIRIPLGNFLSKTALGLKGIWIAMLITYSVSAVLNLSSYLLINRKSDRWKALETA